MPALFVDHLTVIDCSYLHSQRGLLGESWIVDVELIGELDQQGMVFDFGHVKKDIKHYIDQEIDHKLLVPVKNPALKLEQGTRHSELWFDYGDDANNTLALRHLSPPSALCLLPMAEIEATALSHYLQQRLLEITPANVQQVNVRLRTEQIDGPHYQYSHGLKKHAGNCQRIAHGHRSAVQVFAGDQRLPAQEQQWAKRWQDIYLGSQEDLLGYTDTHYQFGYTAAQGLFELDMPKSACDLLDSDSTVELIAEHLRAEIQAGHDQPIVVRAFEGVRKGAIASNQRQ